MKKPTPGELVRNERKKRGFSLSKLAELTKVSQPYLSQIENNKRTPSYEIIHKIRYVLDIDFYLFAWASGLFTDAEYEHAIEQKLDMDSSYIEKDTEKQLDDFNYHDKLNKFKARKYVQIEDFLNNDIESIFINGHKLTTEEINMLIHLFEGKEKNYPSDEFIEKEFNDIREAKRKARKAIESGESYFSITPYYNYDLD